MRSGLERLRRSGPCPPSKTRHNTKRAEATQGETALGAGDQGQIFSLGLLYYRILDAGGVLHGWSAPRLTGHGAGWVRHSGRGTLGVRESAALSGGGHYCSPRTSPAEAASRSRR